MEAEKAARVESGRRQRRAPQRRPDPDGDGEGRCPRHRQEHRRRRARLQQLRDHRPRRHGAGDEDPGDGAGEEGRHHRPLRPDHAVARRDGACRRRDGARRLRHPAADRRRDHQPGPYRGEDPSRATPAARRSMSPTPAARSASSRSCSRPRRKDAYVEDDARGIPEGRRRPCAVRSGEAAPAAGQGARQRLQAVDWSAYEPPKPSFLGTKVFEDYDLAELWRATSTGRPSSRPGS